MTELTELVAGILLIPVAEVNEETGTATTAAWSSLQHVRIIARIEETYGVRLTAREARTCRSVGALRVMLDEKGKLR
ncbi:acyl carrier protein [Streptomyces alkaliphilus]|uniref:acyl carrier protein n=1 Tax=Streptomyces alkaliphilus TaxID=1472722 RepID=UPI002B1FD3C9|nr:acyl carrier protein [Streptomyces alkaliphilus]